MKKRSTHILTIVGCGDAFSSGGNAQTCFHVESPEGTFLIDCGAGTLAGIKKHGLSVAEIDTIIISHFHGDHYGGLPFILLDAAKEKREEPLTIVSPPGGKEKIQQLVELLYPGSNVLDNLNLNYVYYRQEKEITLSYVTVTPIPVAHKPESRPHGIRIRTAQKTIGYSGDTGWTDQLIKIAADTDLFICECCFYATAVDGHLHYLQLCEKTNHFRTKQILLTHFDEEMLANLDKVELRHAYDGLQLII
ncbi:MBL fold metallo-hydrolase [Sphingobacterium haloxyli]|uniref:MBL fold metallo-hydrolase n=1 Tax=Sphingobacterium haloxyli TaxID=2100533 RepID=A0A2S9J451_9SPHI|nr:MBL fold metallo-hydrolase [Sphingobacterium haloxyli]PRD47545.1 MBL fold metallo-hydrolase [Sphingobacterium haloxyli]